MRNTISKQEAKPLLGSIALGAAVFVGSLLVIIVVYAASPLNLPDSASDYSLEQTFFTGVLPLWAGFFAAAFFWSRAKGKPVMEQMRFRFKLVDLPIGFAAALVAQGIVVLTSLLMGLFVNLDGIDDSSRDLADSADGVWGVFMLVLMVVVFTPVFEEIFFRGFLFQALGSRWPGMVISSIIFALTHIYWQQFLPLALFGVIAAWLFRRTGRLGSPIWMHAVFNAVATTALLLTD